MNAAIGDFLRAPEWKRVDVILPLLKDSLSPVELKLVSYKNSMALDMLIKACRRIEANAIAPKPAAGKPAAEKQMRRANKNTVTYQLPDTAQWPEDLQLLRAAVIRWLKEQDSIRGMLKYMYEQKVWEGKKAYMMCERIMALEAMLQDAYQRIDYFALHRQYLPGTAPATIEQRLKYLLKHQVQDSAYVARYKGSADPMILQKVAERSARLREIENLTAHG